jgi:hypothetical protein
MLKLISRWMTVNDGSKRSAQLRQLAAQQNYIHLTYNAVVPSPCTQNLSAVKIKCFAGPSTVLERSATK